MEDWETHDFEPVMPESSMPDHSIAVLWGKVIGYVVGIAFFIALAGAALIGVYGMLRAVWKLCIR